MIRLEECAKVCFLGKVCTITLAPIPTTKEFVLINKNSIVVYRTSKTHDFRQVLLKELRIRSAGYLHCRVRFYCTQYGFKPKKVSIKDTSSRWGSCSSLGNINLNWRLCFAPLEVTDYVIVHELCHLRHMNHSETFWNEVRQIMPDFKKQKKWLKENGQKLCII